MDPVANPDTDAPATHVLRGIKMEDFFNTLNMHNIEPRKEDDGFDSAFPSPWIRFFLYQERCLTDWLVTSSFQCR